MLLSEPAQGAYLLGWGWNGDYQADPVPTNVMAGAEVVSAGYFHSLALKGGRAWAWGNNAYGQTNVPAAAQSGVTNIAAGHSFNLALKTDGSVIPWGASLLVTNQPVSTTSGVSKIAAGDWHALALKDGGVIAWGSNTFGQCVVPSELASGVTNIAAGGYYSMALKDGAVHVFGIPASNTLSRGIRAVPPEASNNVTAISAGKWHALALRDGGVIAWGAVTPSGTNSYSDATNVPPEAASDVVAISAGNLFSMAVKADGTLLVWGDDTKGQWPVPAYGTNASSVSAGGGHALILGPVMPPRFVGSDLPTAYLGVSYVGSVMAAGEPAVTYSKINPAPSWVTIDPGTGAIGGTPDALGSSLPVTLVASNAYGTTTNTYRISVFEMPAGPPVFVTSSPLPNGQVGIAYSQQIVASNNPTFSLVSGEGELPVGLTLSTSGLISGIPSSVFNGFFTVRATNIAGASNRVYNITIDPPPLPPGFVTESPLPSGVVGQPYSTQIVASNNPVFDLFSGSLPAGLALGTNGTISGTPTQIGNPLFTVRATNTVGASYRDYTLQIFGPPVFTTESPLPTGLLNEPYSQQIAATGDPIFSLFDGVLPDGLALSTNGVVSGTPGALGAFGITIRATNDYGWSNRYFDILIGAKPIFTTPNPLPGGTSDVPYSVQIQADYADSFSVAAGTLPAGLDLAAGGLLSGIPTAAGNFIFTVRATNTYGTSDREYDLTIASQDELLKPRFIDPWTNVAPPTPAYYQLRIEP
jgi:hypothetical protein